jgi:hypothetical protein
MSTDDGMRAAIEALPVGTVVRLGHTFPETGNFQGSQYLRTRHGLRYIGPGRDDSDAITLHQQVQMCDDFRVDARPTSVLPDPTADTVQVEATFNKRTPDHWTFDVVDSLGVVCSVPAAGLDDDDAQRTASRIAALAAEGGEAR